MDLHSIAITYPIKMYKVKNNHRKITTIKGIVEYQNSLDFPYFILWVVNSYALTVAENILHKTISFNIDNIGSAGQ